MNLGKTLQELRKEKNISQEDMAEILNVSRQTISNWENSKSYPDILALIKLCDVYKISLDDLLKDDQKLLDSIKKENKKKNKIITICISTTIIFILLFIYFIFFKDHYKEMYKKEVQMIVNNKENFIEITKSKKYNQDIMTDNYMKITDTEYKNITSYLEKNKYNYKTVYHFTNFHKESTDTIGYVHTKDILKLIKDDRNTTPFLTFTADLDIVRYEDFNNFFENNIIGKYPSNDKEILISNALANLIIDRGIKTIKEDFYPKNYEEIINYNEFYYFGTSLVKISGIINYDLSKFNDIKEISWTELNNNYKKYKDIYNDYLLKVCNIYNKIYVNEDFISNLKRSSEGKIWEQHLTRTGILIIEKNKDKLNKILNKFNQNPYKVKSTYTEIFNYE